jgi:hypothetical protein
VWRVIVTWFTAILQLSVLKTRYCSNWQLLHYGVVRFEPLNIVRYLLRFVEQLLGLSKQ